MCIQDGVDNLSISSLADMMDNTEKDILRALKYWEKCGILRIQRDKTDGTVTGIEMLNPDNSAAAEHAKNRAGSAPVKTGGAGTADSDITITMVDVTDNSGTEDAGKAEQTSLSPGKQDAGKKKDSHSPGRTVNITVTAEQTARLSKDDVFSWICLIVENYLKRPLQTAEIQLLTYLYDNLHFSKELILHLYEYCCSLQKTNAKYVQAVALSWAEQGITTPEEAQEFSVNYTTSHTAISKALALGRPLAGIECQFVKRWEKEWNMELSVILEACNRTMLSIHKPDFKYIDSILGNWHRNNVHTLQDIQKCDENYQKTKNAAKPKARTNPSGKQNQFQAFQQRDASPDEMEQLEKLLLTR